MVGTMEAESGPAPPRRLAAAALLGLTLAAVAGTLGVGAWTSDVAGSQSSVAAHCAAAAVPDILALEFAGDAERARALLPDECADVHLTEMVRRDSAFILAYTALLGFLCLWGANNFRSQKMRVAGTVGFAVTLVVAALDVVENVALTDLGDREFDAAVRVTAAAVPKWALVTVVMGYALGALVTMAVRVVEPDRSGLLRAPGIDRHTVWAPDHLRVAQRRGASPLADDQDQKARWWWASRPPFATGWHQGAATEPPIAGRVGIAFSGGGIRSASYNLGCLQALLGATPPTGVAGDNVVEAARYLASVSGGGYLAGGRQMAVHAGAGGEPFDAGSSQETHLIGGARYLWHTAGERAQGLVPVVASILLNVAVLVALVFVVARPVGWAAFGADLVGPVGGGDFALQVDNGWVLAGPALALVAVAAAAFGLRSLPSMVGSVARAVAVVFGLAALVPVLWLSLLWPWCATIGAVAGASVLVLVVAHLRRPRAKLIKKSSAGVLLALTGLGLTLAWVRVGAREGWTGTSGAGRIIMVVLLVFFVLVVAAWFLVQAYVEGPVAKGVCPAVLITLLAAGGALAAGRVLDGPWFDLVLREWAWLIVIGGALLATFAFVDQTRWSPHRFYKRRLAKAFAAPYQEDMTTFSDWGVPVSNQPTLLTCAAVHLPGQSYGRRTVGSFTFAHDLVGGPDIGWVPTTDFEQVLRGKQQEDGTVQAAMAISGAAVASANGYMDLGSVNAALAILNTRLGVWLPNPTHVHELVGRRRAPEGTAPSWARIRRISYLLKEVFGVYDPMDRFAYVSDGGHHDNLALIELLRRRCGVILCFDASGDTPPTPTTFNQVRERAADELGVSFTALSGDEGLQDGTGRVAVYRISYPSLIAPPRVTGADLPLETGLLVMAKCRLLEDPPPDLPDGLGRWPNDSTANQWFEPARVEAYRDLGKRLGDEAVAAWASAAAPAEAGS